MIWQLIGKLQSLLQQSAEGVLTALIYVAIIVAIAHYLGWLDRWIWFVLEAEALKITNGAQVTIGSFTIDWSELLQGKITLHASNVVIHTPQRNEWQWDSPLIARIGKATVECNALITVFHAVFLRREVPIEAYTVVVTDAQVFVERRKSVINVYLLNPTLQLPPPPYPKKMDDNNSGKTGTEPGPGPISVGDPQANSDNNNKAIQRTGPEVSVPTANNFAHPDSANTPDMSPLSSINAKAKIQNNHDDDDDDDDSLLQPVQEETSTFFDTTNNSLEDDTSSSNHRNHNQQAKVLVNEMLHAVQVLGGAAARGQLPGAIKQQGLELVGRLQGFREQENLEEGIRVMQQVGKVAVESLQSAPQLILPKPDSTRERKKRKIIYIRIGRIAINDLRIFTKDSWINATSSQDDLDSISGTTIGATGTPIKSNIASRLPSSIKKVNNGTSNAATNTTTVDTNNNQNGSWNKPIYIERMILRSSELSPPMSMKDSDNLPAIYQSVDKLMEVVWKRLLAEIAKSNTGKLFSTAMGEVLSVMVSNPQHSVSLLSTPSLASTFGGPNTSINTSSSSTVIP